MARPRVFSSALAKAVRQTQTQKEKQIKRKMQAKCLHLFLMLATNTFLCYNEKNEKIPK
jgi:hypothetical protein